LLGIDLEHSREFEREITGGCEGIKPGWVRVNFNYFISEPVFDYVVSAVSLVARDGWRLLGDYRFDPDTGLWRHRRGASEPELRLSKVGYDQDGQLSYPRRRNQAPESELVRYLDEATTLLSTAGDRSDEPPSPAGRLDDGGLVSADFEHLRWFELPAACLVK
jgi:hypothetical protein